MPSTAREWSSGSGGSDSTTLSAGGPGRPRSFSCRRWICARRPVPNPVSTVELDPVLRRERAREIGTRNEAERDDRLTEPLARHLLLDEGAFELVVGQKTLFDEQASKGTPGNAGRFHKPDIGAVGPGDKRFLTRCLFRVRSSG